MKVCKCKHKGKQYKDGGLIVKSLSKRAKRKRKRGLKLERETPGIDFITCKATKRDKRRHERCRKLQKKADKLSDKANKIQNKKTKPAEGAIELELRRGGKMPKKFSVKSGDKSAAGGLTAKGVRRYRAANPGSKLKTAVTTKPSKLKAGSKSAKRRKSFCSRMKGMKSKLTSAKTARDPNSRINKALRKWNC